MRVFTRLLLLFMLFNTIVATSQSTLTIGSSTSTFETTSAGAATATSTVPISSCWGYSYTQQIYTKAELNAAGMPSTGSQTINAIRFYYVGNSATSNSTTNSSNWTVYLSHTAGTSVGTAFLTAGLTQVFSGTVSFPSTGGWVTIPCSGFDYNNTDNLVVSVDENQASYDCSIFFRNTDVASTNNTYYRNDTNNPSPTSPPTGTTTNDRANIQIDYTGLVPCSGTPAPGNTVSSANPICSGTSITLSLQNSTAGSGITYQWQSSPDGSTWSDISGANSAYYSTTQSVATYYRCNVTCSGNTGASTALQVTMNPFMNCYCVTTPSTVNGVDIITGVSVGAYSNSSNGNDADNYISVNNTPPNLQLSGTYSGSITYGTDATQYGAAWIDWNQNGTFEASENIYLSSSSSGASTTVTFSFTVPAGATLGNTMIRFRGGSDSAYTTGGACTTSSFGETEDYLVNIVAATCTSPTVSAATVVPNCGSNQWSYTFDITSLGSASSLSLTGGNTSVSTVTSVPTTVTVGPFASGATGNNVLISGGDINCDYTVTAPAAYNCPQPGWTCADPFIVSSYPYTASGTTCGAGNDLGTQCGGFYGGGEDFVYQLNITTVGTYLINLSATGSGSYIGWFLKDGASCTTGSSCLTSATSSSGITANGTYNFTTPGTYYLIIDTWPSPNCSAYNISIIAPCTPPAAVITPTPSAVLSCSTPSITLTATPSGQASYTWGGGSASGTSESISVTSAGTYTVTISNGSCSSTASVTVTGTLCEAPTSPSFSNVTTTSADLAWTSTPAPHNDPDGEYQFYYSTSSTPPTVSTSGTYNWGPSVSISGLSCGTTYYAWVRSACDVNCYSSWTGPATVTTSACPLLPNDNCSGAININGGGVAGIPTGTPITSTTVGATSSGAASSCGGTADDDVWFEFTTDTDPSDGQDYSIVVSGASFTPVITLYSGGCSGTEVNCVVGTSLSGVGLASGTQYFVRVYDNATGLTHGEGSSRAGGFSIAASGTALPVTLATLKAIAVNNINVISWSTSSELNTKKFIVERSVNGNSNWSKVGEVAASGTTAETRNYSLNDEKPLSLSYYRLVTVDVDGTSKVSNVVSVQRSKDAFGIINIFPVPSHETVTVTYESTDRSNIEINVYDILGKHVLSMNKLSDLGINNFSIPVQQLTNGVYTITIGNGANTATSKFVKE